MVLLMVLLERVLCASEGLLSKISWQPLLLCCFLLTSKELDDEPVSFRDLRMLAVMHDLRSAVGGYGVHGRFTVWPRTASPSLPATTRRTTRRLRTWSCSCCSCCSGAPSVLPLTLSTAGSASSTGRSRSWPSPIMALRGQRCSARPTGSTCTSARMHACTTPIVTEPTLSSPGLGCRSMLDAGEPFLEDLGADCEERVPSLASDEEDTQKPSSSQRGRPRAPAGVTVYTVV